MGKRGRTGINHRDLLYWARSWRSRQRARDMCRAFNAERWRLPKCRAVAKHSGAPCRNVAMENGRCRFHGGLVPKGRDWHRIQYNPSADPKAADKKLAAVEKRRKQQKARVARMTSAEREAYDRWQESHRPGSRSERERRRRDLETRQWLADLMAAKEK